MKVQLKCIKKNRNLRTDKFSKQKNFQNVK